MSYEDAYVNLSGSTSPHIIGWINWELQKLSNGPNKRAVLITFGFMSNVNLSSYDREVACRGLAKLLETNYSDANKEGTELHKVCTSLVLSIANLSLDDLAAEFGHLFDGGDYLDHSPREVSAF